MDDVWLQLSILQGLPGGRARNVREDDSLSILALPDLLGLRADVDERQCKQGSEFNFFQLDRLSFAALPFMWQLSPRCTLGGSCWKEELTQMELRVWLITPLQSMAVADITEICCKVNPDTCCRTYI